MNVINKYIAKRVIKSVFIAFIIITGIIMLIDFVETSRNLGGDIDISMAGILLLTALNAPMLVEQTIPFVVLFGVMGALFSLNRHSELIVLRASGLSAWNFLKPVIIVTLVLGALWTIAFNPFAAISQEQRAKLMQQINPEQISKTENKPIWLREGREHGHIIIHAKRINIGENTLYDVTFYEFEKMADNMARLTSRYDAKKAELFKQGYWMITDVLENEVGKPAKKYEAISRNTTITINDLRDSLSRKDNTQFWHLQAGIKKAQKSGYDPTRLIIKFNKLLAMPLTLVAMAIIAAGASLNLSRSGGGLRLLIIGGVIGFGMFFIDNLIAAFGETGTLPPALAAWSVPVLVLLFSLSYLSWIEDG